MRLCLTPVSKSRLRPSCNEQHSAAGLASCTRKTCPKKRSKETTSVAFSNSPCKSRLISLPIADMAFANIQILRQYHHTPCKFEPAPILIPTRFRSATALLSTLAWRAEALPRSIRADLALLCILRPPERRHIALPVVCSRYRREALMLLFLLESKQVVVGGNHFFNNVEMNCCHDSVTSAATSAPTCFARRTVPQTFSCAQDE